MSFSFFETGVKNMTEALDKKEILGYTNLRLIDLTIRRSEYGGVAQLARAFGSYPKCHRFESSRRYHGPLGSALGALVKRLRHRPFTAVTRVRFPSGSPIWRLSSAGRALASHARGHRFEFCSLHQINIIRIYSPLGTGSDLLFTSTISAHRKAAPVT